MKRPITLGTILSILFLGYFIGAFLLYIEIYSFNEFWYGKPEGVFMYSAGLGIILLFISSIFLIFKYLFPVIEKIWNYPIIK